MRQTLLALLLSLWLLPSTAADKPWDNGPLRVSDNHRFLQFQNGEPFFWLGDTGWLLPQRLDRVEVGGYFTQCAEAGYNVVQIQVMDGVPSYNIYGQPSLTKGWDMSAADPEGVYSYWDHLDYIVEVAARHGIYIGMVPIWGTMVQEERINARQAKAYATFLANRYKNCPNIIWMIGGDLRGDIHPEVWETLGETIKSIDHTHLMTFHPRGRYTSAHWWSKAKWIDFHMFQSGHRKYDQRMTDKTYPIPDGTEEDNWMYVDSTWAYKPIKPVIDGEPVYEAIPKGLHDPYEELWQDYDVRRYAYWSVFAGSFGHTYGHNAVMQMMKPGCPTGYGIMGQVKNWYDAQHDPGYQQMRWLKALMLAMPFFERVPDQSVIVGNNGKRYDRLIATRGNDYLMVYDYNSNEITVDLTRISGTRKALWWMDAATGKLSALGVTADKTYRFTPKKYPTGVHDGVFIAIEEGKDYLHELAKP
jgi:hypothetical protein